MQLSQLINRFRVEANDKVEPYFIDDDAVINWLNDQAQLHRPMQVTSLGILPCWEMEELFYWENILVQTDRDGIFN